MVAVETCCPRLFAVEMQILPGLLSGIAMIFLIVKPGYADIWYPISKQAFLDPIDYSLGKKSCSDGYVHGIDNFIITGFLNVTGFTLPKVPAYFSVWYFYRWGLFPIWSTYYDLWEDTCHYIIHVPLDKCRCEYKWTKTILLKCNLTVDIQYRNKPFRLNFITSDYSFSAQRVMTKVYRDALCGKRATRSGGSSPHGSNNEMPGLIFLATALVCTVTSMFSNGQRTR